MSPLSLKFCKQQLYHITTKTWPFQSYGPEFIPRPFPFTWLCDLGQIISFFCNSFVYIFKIGHILECWSL